MRSRTVVLCCGLIACTSPTPSPRESAAHEEPLWAATATQPTVARAAPAVLLPSGRVLVTGGDFAPTELFNPFVETWASSAPLAQPQSNNLLELWSGRATSLAGSRVESFDGVSQWAVLQSPAFARIGADAVSLPDGRLIVIGGQGAASSQAELLELDGGWTLLLPSTAPHVGHTATLTVGQGAIAVVGGGTSVAETYDLTFGFWTPRPGGPERSLHTASLLPSGQLLLVGGRSLLDGGIAGAERYDPASGARVSVAGLREPRLSHAAVALPGGDVLVTGGEGPGAARSAERYLAALDRFVPSGCLDTPRGKHAAVVLPDGGVVLIGGVGPDGGLLARSERLDFSSGLLAQGQPCALDCQCGSGFCADGVCCDGACNGACNACSVARGAAVDGTCGLAGSARICRPAVSGCDLDERCTGASPVCPADSIRNAGFVCNPAAGNCDVPELCDGLTALCPVDRVLDAGVSCRGDAGPCDVAEQCNGVSGLCPVDSLVDAGVVCRAAGTGGCDVAEVCSGASVACPADRFADAGVVCRPSDAGCDVAETCTGGGASCPVDGIANPGVSCRAAVGPCDVEETCQGARACPADRLRDAGATCRLPAGGCDVADVCDGLVAGCADRFVIAGIACRPADGGCDVGEVCSGVAASCPADAKRDAGTVCRAAMSGCDRVEVCDGVANACPADGVQDAGVPCRAAAGACDRAEACTGTSNTCPPDGRWDAGFVCRAPAGDCDEAEQCDGVEVSCPADGLKPADFVCRMSAGACDLAETCEGTSAACPGDRFAAETNACRPAVGSCDVAETCAGAAECPVDVTTCDADAGMEPQKHYVGWNCSSAGGTFPGLIALLLLLVLKRPLSPRGERAGVRGQSEARRHGGQSLLVAARDALRRRRLFSRSAPSPHPSPREGRGGFVVAVLLLWASPTRAATDAPVTSDFAVRVNVSLMRGVLASRLGGELGANLSLTPRFDLAALVTFGSNVGARLGVTWHLKDDGEWVRPFVQLRGLIHPVAEGVAGGGGAWAGLFVPVGPGRIQAGALFEAYLGPKGYAPYDLFVTLGYELDLYRRIERAGQQPPKEVVEAEVPPINTDPLPLTEPERPIAPPPPKPATPAPPPADRTKVVTRVSLAKDFVLFEERRVGWQQTSEGTVRKVIDVLKRYPQLQRIEISGHADDGDTPDECMKLSLRRAERVLAALLAAGIEPTRLTAKGYGKTMNKVPTTGPARKRSMNRRVDFAVLQES